MTQVTTYKVTVTVIHLWIISKPIAFMLFKECQCYFFESAIPPLCYEAYGEEGSPPDIPGKACLIFIMEIIKINGATHVPLVP